MPTQALSASRIAEAAISLIDQEGLAKLSMRKLGSALGVKAMSLYNHVSNKSEVLNLVHERLLTQLEVAAPSKDWRKPMEETAWSFLALLKAHPQAIPLFASRSAVSPGSARVVDRCLGVLKATGLSQEECFYTFQAFFSLVVGHAMFRYGPRDENSFIRPEVMANFPNLSTLGPELIQDGDAEFRFALNVFLSGLENCSSLQIKEQDP